MDGQQQYADAMRAFDAYYGTRRQAFGIDWPAKRYGEHRLWKTFMKIAAVCADKGRDVEKYVTTVLGHLQKNSAAVIPNDLLTKRAESIWTEHMNDRKTDASGKWAYFVQQVIQIQMADGRSDEAILRTSLNAQFPAWFRVMYPETMDEQIVASYGEEALLELRNDRDLVRFLRAAMAAKMEAFEKRMGVIDGL